MDKNQYTMFRKPSGEGLYEYQNKFRFNTKMGAIIFSHVAAILWKKITSLQKKGTIPMRLRIHFVKNENWKKDTQKNAS